MKVVVAYVMNLIKGLTLLVGGLGILSVWTDRLSPVDYSLMYFLGLAVPILMIGNLFLFIFWCIRKEKWAILPLISFLFNIGYLGLVYRFQSFPTHKMASSFKIATYNIGGVEGDNRKLIFTEIADSFAKENVNLICLQEVRIDSSFTYQNLQKCFERWGYHSVPKSEKQPILQIAFFSKFPLEKTQLITYKGGKNCSMWSDVLIERRRIRIINNHLQTTAVSAHTDKINHAKHEEKTDYFELYSNMLFDMKSNVILRVNQAKIIRQIVDTTKTPIILCGDFNSIPSSYTYKMLKGDNLVDGFIEAGQGYMGTYKYFKRALRIDYVLHSKSLKGLKCYSPQYDYSDHYPVIMELGYSPLN